MTTISVNNEKVKDTDSKQLSVKELTDLMIEHSEKSEVLTSIQIDDKEYFLNEENDKILDTMVTSHKNVNFVFSQTIELAYEALDSSSNYIEYIEEQIRNLVEQYNTGEHEKADKTFTEVIDVMDLFIQLVSNIHNAYRSHYKEDYQKGELIQNLEIHLLSVLKALIPAKEKNDIILLCDLLEYELIDNLTQWKIKALPALRSFRNN